VEQIVIRNCREGLGIWNSRPVPSEKVRPLGDYGSRYT
jgi:hypothetical protein